MQVIQICEKKRKPQPKYILVDTPGQIEIFTWSASGAIITEAFASTFPTMVAYVVDTARSAAPQTFMSNMLQASPLCLSGADARRGEQSVLPCESRYLACAQERLQCAPPHILYSCALACCIARL